MMACKYLIVLALAAVAYAAEEERVKKDVLLGTVGTVGTIPYAYSAIPYSYAAAYDDGKYYPGKYEKAIVAAPALTAYHTAPLATHVAPVAQISNIPSVVPAAQHISAYSAHSVHPLPYASYPYHYSAYPYYKSYVY